MIIVLGSLITDCHMRLPTTSARLDELHRVSRLELGPGGAANVAITAARLGLSVGCLGEVGDDPFGRTLLDGLAREGIDRSNVRVTAGARTPVALVLVDDSGEPSYLGYPGRLQMNSLPESWHKAIQQAEALFADGWAEHEDVPEMVLEAFRLARAAGVPVFFDPGPGAPAADDGWHQEAAALANVVLATGSQAAHLTGRSDPEAAARAILATGPELVVLKMGADGCLLLNGERLEVVPAFPVQVRDMTGAGDSFDAALLYGYLRGLGLRELGILANAAGAVKAQKLGTGHNMPEAGEIQELLQHFGAADAAFGLD